MVRIFLSHNSRDQSWCEWLKASAEEVGVSAYLAEHDAQPGVNLASKVTAALDASDALVVLISDNSVTAPYVNQEIGYALKAGKLVIPLVQDGISLESLAMLQGVEFIPSDFEHPYEGHTQLRAALRRLVQQQANRQDVATRQRETALLALACLALVFLAIGAD